MTSGKDTIASTKTFWTASVFEIFSFMSFLGQSWEELNGTHCGWPSPTAIGCEIKVWRDEIGLGCDTYNMVPAIHAASFSVRSILSLFKNIEVKHWFVCPASCTQCQWENNQGYKKKPESVPHEFWPLRKSQQTSLCPFDAILKPLSSISLATQEHE